MSKYIEHPGIVKAWLGDNKILVGITSVSACAQCHSKVACTMSEIKEKEVEVDVKASDFPVGTKVIVRMPIQTGSYAVILSYVLPLIVLVVVIVLAQQYFQNELLAGILGLCSLVPYFLILFLYNERIKKKIHFSVRKCVETL
ncbi:MAG: SoxR reducing system RseC family protein [Bacteroidales bacterium]|nr:SoxR reducing system RseC family protein [Bacteroidales bacterium]